MTTITSMETFEALDVGSIVSVGTNAWERGESGWSHAGFTVEPHHFAGDIAQGNVFLGARPQAGQMWSNEGPPNYGYTFMLIAEIPGETDRWWALRFSDDQFSRLDRIRFVTGRMGRLVTDPPAWAPMALAMGIRWVQTLNERDTYATQVNDLRVQVANVRNERDRALQTLRSNIETGLHNYMSENSIEPTSPLGELLVSNGMRRPNEIVVVSCQVRVSKYVDLSPEMASTLAGVEGASNVSAGSTYVTFEVPVTVRVECEAGSCGCRLATRRRVREALAEQHNLTGADFSVSRTSCPHDEREAEGGDPF